MVPRLRGLSKEAGISYEITGISDAIKGMTLFEHYDDPNCLCMRYEDVLADPMTWFHKAFRHYGFDNKQVRQAGRIARSISFESSGRKLGQEDRKSHKRKGTPGDWKNHFTDEHRELFKEHLGDICVTLGYEKDNDW
jgi:hypothetical protein